MKILLQMILLAVFLCSAEEIISGRILNSDGSGIPGAQVSLDGTELKAITNANGEFSIPVTTRSVDFINKGSFHRKISILDDSRVELSLEKKSGIQIMAFNTSGQIISKKLLTREAGTHTIRLQSPGPGICIYRIIAGSDQYILKGTSLEKTYLKNMGTLSASSLSKKNAIADQEYVLEVKKEGYVDYRVEVKVPESEDLTIKPAKSAGTVTDIDGNVYQTVKIGNQVWTVENLRTTKLNNGVEIAHVTDSSKWGNSNVNRTFVATDTAPLPTNGDPYPQYCFYNNTTDPDTIKRFGALYNWWAVNTGMLAPEGWRVPDTSDWNDLMSYLYESSDGDTVLVAKALSAGTDWNEEPGSIGDNKLANNSSGFAAVPVGYRTGTPMILFIRAGYDSYWWSSTDLYPSYKRYFALYNFKDGRPSASGISGHSPDFGFPVRLIKN
ncbi:MAG: hypothetical protein GX556_09385 [Fibrobacter sp.]|nr:hypothetical protein [Fibrobacter sp.]